MISRRTILVGGAGLALAAAASFAGFDSAWAQPRPVPNAVSTIDVPGVGPMTVLTFDAQFVSADPATRRVVLQGSWGKRWSVLVPPMMGDVMRLANSRSLVIRVLPGLVTYLGKAHQGTPGQVSTEVALNAGLPGWPQDFGFREITITSILVDINKAGGTISFEGIDGLVRTVRATDPKVLADLQHVALGDLCEIRYYEGIAITTVR
ncbi:hypothetical protein [Aquabacter spiritensis]|uniref:Secreted protein n=1 Tax=Aquabacter spiritensis TaxID=933073 RepID=A0A4V2UYC7_9HYPH|nr:hypothetical protein [Aquabacter spiritensis]TCT06868.1 hypothetical protein EDC64_102349 [Aquabacter spiritensis]